MKNLFIFLFFLSALCSVESATAFSAFPVGKFSSSNSSQQNLIGEVSSVDAAIAQITIKTQSGVTVVLTDDKTAFRRILPGQTSLANAEKIAFVDVKVGDRVLVPGGIADAKIAVKQIIIIAREAINAQRDNERELRRARTFVGRISAINLQNREITVQGRGRSGNAEPIVVVMNEKSQIKRYASDSLKPADAIASNVGDLQVGDQIRIIGDRDANANRITADEILSGSVSRIVGGVVGYNSSQNTLAIKDSVSGQTSNISLGKNTVVRRITSEVAENLKQLSDRREQRRRERQNQNNTANNSTPATAGQATNNDRANRPRRGQQQREGNAGEAGNRNAAGRGGFQQFDNLPTIAPTELKSGDAVMITATGTAGKMTAVTIISGEGDLLKVLQRSQGGRGNNPNSPGLPGNISGGNTTSDPDEPR